MQSAREDPEELLGRAAWARSLALELLGDPGRADDAAQEGLIAAWRTGPHESGSLDAWLRTAVRRFAGKARRSAARRAEHERGAARAEALPSASELVERAEAHRAVVAAVLALDEPYRSTVLLRYVEELAPSEIAARAGVPVRTVNTRLQRGLARLRERLDRDHRDPRALLAALIPLPKSAVVATPWLGVLLVKSSSKVALAACLLIGIGAAVFVTLRAQRAAGPSASSDSPSRVIESTERGDGPSSNSSDERAAALVLPQAPTAQVSDSQTATLRGRVRDAAGDPIAGALVEALHSPTAGFLITTEELAEPASLIASTHTNTDGAFELELRAGQLFDVRASAPGYATEMLTARYSSDELTIQLDRAASVFGFVLRASDDTPVERASVRVFFGVEEGLELETRTDATGRFRLDGLVPGRVGLLVITEREQSSRWAELELAAGEALQHDVHLETGITLHGRVLDAVAQTPIAGAEVSSNQFLSKTARTDARGEFEISGLPELRSLLVAARAPGYGQGERRIGEDVPSELVLLLSPARSAVGRVLSPTGAAVADARVIAMVYVFDSGTVRRDVSSARSDADGRFELADLRADLRHTLYVRVEGFATKVEPFPADEAERSVIDFGDVRLARSASIEGRIIDDSGAARARALVELRPFFADRSAEEDLSDSTLAIRQVQTDAAGRFAIDDLQAGSWSMRVLSGGLPPREDLRLDLVEGERREGFEVVLSSGLTIDGWVADEHGRPMADVSVAAIPEEDRHASMADVTGADGRFRLTGLASRPHEISARALDRDGRFVERYEVWRQTGVFPAAGALEIRLALKSETISGLVVDAQGEAVANAMVWTGPEALPPLDFVIAGADGRFELRVTPEVPLVLHARRTVPLSEAKRAPSRSELRAGRVALDEADALLRDVAPGASGVVLTVPAQR